MGQMHRTNSPKGTIKFTLTLTHSRNSLNALRTWSHSNVEWRLYKYTTHTVVEWGCIVPVKELFSPIGSCPWAAWTLFSIHILWSFRSACFVVKIKVNEVLQKDWTITVMLCFCCSICRLDWYLSRSSQCGYSWSVFSCCWLGHLPLLPRLDVLNLPLSHKPGGGGKACLFTSC